MTIPVSFAGTLSYPPDGGQPNCTEAIALSVVATSKAAFDYVLTGAGTQTVDFGTITPNGAKLVKVEVEPDSSPAAAAIFIQWNGEGATGQVEIAPGGFVVVGNPTPTSSGLLSIDIVHTTNTSVKVTAFG